MATRNEETKAIRAYKALTRKATAAAKSANSARQTAETLGQYARDAQYAADQAKQEMLRVLAS